jgi:signal transduction histidine kinase
VETAEANPRRVAARLLYSLRATADVSAEIASAHDFETTARSSLLSILGAVSATRGALYLVRDDARLELLVGRGINPGGSDEWILDGESLKALVRHGSALKLGAEDGEPNALTLEISRRLPELALCSPLVVRNELLGILGIGSKLTREPYSDLDTELVYTLATMLASGIHSHYLIRGLQQSNQRLREMQEQLIEQERLATVGQSAAAIAHEVRNPLTSIRGFAATIHDSVDELTPEMIREFSRFIEEDAERLAGIIEEVRNYSRRTGYEMEPCSLVEVAEETLSFTRFDSLLRRIDIQRDYTSAPRVMVNRGKMKQVLLNILRNAAQAIADPREGEIRVAVYEENGFGVLSVTDNGTGIPVEKQSSIFEPFYTTKGEQGTGLGLQICKQIVENHGGTIDFRSAVGTGTTFFIRLPMVAAGCPPECPGDVR